MSETLTLLDLPPAPRGIADYGDPDAVTEGEARDARDMTTRLIAQIEALLAARP